MDEHRGRTLALVAVLILGTAAVALLLTSWLRGGSPDQQSAGPPSNAPKDVRGMAVMSVSAAIPIQTGNSGADIAVAGWFQQSYALPCPAPLPPVVPPLTGDCQIGMTWLMQNPETLIQSTRDASRGSNSESAPVGPAVNPVFDGPATDWANPLPQNGESAPTPVVFVGHFDDPRAQGCQPAEVQACKDRFVVTAVPWANGIEDP